MLKHLGEVFEWLTWSVGTPDQGERKDFSVMEDIPATEAKVKKATIERINL